MDNTLPTTLVRDLLLSGRNVRLVARGWSMRPLLRDGDIVEITPAALDTLRPGDVAAYALPVEEPEVLIVHRLLGIGASGARFRGDACPAEDGAVARAAILGRVVVRERNGRRTRLDTPWRRGMGWAAVWTRPLSRMALRTYGRCLTLYRGGPPLRLASARDLAMGQRVIRLILGEIPDDSTDLEQTIETIVSDPRYRELAPFAAWRVRESGLDLPEDLVDQLADIENQALVLSARIEAMLRDLTHLLRDTGHDLLAVKGAAFAFGGTYPSPHLRLGADVDTICRPGEERRLVRDFVRCGFRNAEPEYPLSYYLRYRAEVALFHGAISRHPLEVHWRAGGRANYDRRLPTERLWESSTSSPWGEALRFPTPEAAVVHSIAHLTKHLRALRPVWALDIALLARGGLDWDGVVREIGRARLEWPAWHVLRWVEAVAPGNVPLEAIRAVARGRRRGPGNWLEMRVLHARSDRQVRWIEALCLPTWGQRLGYLSEQIAPSRRVMERLYPQAQGRFLGPLYVRRWLRLAREGLSGTCPPVR